MRPLMELLVGVWGCDGDGKTVEEEEDEEEDEEEEKEEMWWWGGGDKGAGEQDGGLRALVREREVSEGKGSCATEEEEPSALSLGMEQRDGRAPAHMGPQKMSFFSPHPCRKKRTRPSSPHYLA
ncbi:hypothetical protein PBY51_003440 [Eleginops maclovinus]|uniref:Uncharacterized protein n=1 Tax=Eleginops maclovinus TaxID=56733 RepID=A0AAN7XV36_ELEMC|nr:hypothetical protein PBY51_003440 [Eleginops maclovinus]